MIYVWVILEMSVLQWKLLRRIIDENGTFATNNWFTIKHKCFIHFLWQKYLQEIEQNITLVERTANIETSRTFWQILGWSLLSCDIESLVVSIFVGSKRGEGSRLAWKSEQKPAPLFPTPTHTTTGTGVTPVLPCCNLLSDPSILVNLKDRFIIWWCKK